MKCNYCGSTVKYGSNFCENCGAPVGETLNSGSGAAAKQNTLSVGTALGRAAREARLYADYSNDEIISSRAYNLILVGTVLWGLVVNAFLCVKVGDVYRYINPILFFVLYLVCGIAGIRIAAKSKDPKISFLGYNMIVVPFGLVISTLVQAYGGLSSSVVSNAFIYTALITVGMLGAVMAFPELFQKIGGVLFGCLAGLVICEIVLLIFRIRHTYTDYIAAGIFSLYIGYDIYRSQQFAKTVDNAVDCALDIYLDIANLFVRLLQIMGNSKKRN